MNDDLDKTRRHMIPKIELADLYDSVAETIAQEETFDVEAGLSRLNHWIDGQEQAENLSGDESPSSPTSETLMQQSATRAMTPEPFVVRGGLRVGVVGCGYWGSKHVRVLNALDLVARVAVVDPNLERVWQVARIFPDMDYYASLEEALPHLDAVIIATPPSTHKPLALMAITAGVHVMVETPMATTSADARIMVAAAKDAGVVLMVGHTFEYHSAVWKLREMVQNRELGELYYLDTARLNLGLYQTDSNVLYDLAPHDISILNYVLGDKPVSVQCWTSRHANPQQEDVAYLRLTYENPDVIANIHVSWLDPDKVRRVTMVGSEKMVVFNDLDTQERIKVHDKGVSKNAGEDLTTRPMSYWYGDVVLPYLVVNEPLMVQDEHFLDCAISGMHPMTDAENGLAVIRVLEAAQRSANEGRPVRLDELAADTSKVVADQHRDDLRRLSGR